VRDLSVTEVSILALGIARVMNARGVWEGTPRQTPKKEAWALADTARFQKHTLPSSMRERK
jgi:hypothetical protein